MKLESEFGDDPLVWYVYIVPCMWSKALALKTYVVVGSSLRIRVLKSALCGPLLRRTSTLSANHSSFPFFVTTVTCPFGRTNSYSATVSTVSPNWLVFQEYPGFFQLMRCTTDQRWSPPPSVRLETPTVPQRPPTLMPLGTKYA
jgi:hypothetical protein